jgi:hypothetical protein
MPDPRPLLDRLLKTPHLATIVPRLGPDVLHRVIQRCGLEDCAELVALATPQQLAHILDIDIWRVRSPGADDTLDADRFGVWIDVLMLAGAPTAAEKLIGLDIELAIAGFSRLAAIFDHAAVSSFTTLDGEERSGRPPHDGPVAEIGGYRIEAKLRRDWDAIVELLGFLDAEHPEFFHRLMRGCVRLSNGRAEADGFHDLLDDQDQDLFDLACDRESRREQQGYLSPAQARAFLQAARELRLDAGPPPPDPIARAYFRAIDSPELFDRNDGRVSFPAALPASGAADAGDVDAGALASVIEVLRDAGVLAPPPRALLQAPDGDSSRPASIEAYVAAHAESALELAYLANALMAGCTVQDRPFTPREASDAAIAVCNLGLENWPPRWPNRVLITAFQVGWTLLYRLCVHVATRLIDTVANLKSTDRDIQLGLRALARELGRHLRDGAPWRARHALEVLLILDAPSWAGLLGLIDQCPVMHAAVEPRRGSHAINVGDFAFISHNSQIESVRAFMELLPSTLRD